MIDVTEDMDVVALRNGEIVLNRNVVREFAWKKADGDIGSVVITDRPRHPTRGMDLHIATPWFAFYNREIPCALGSLDLLCSAADLHLCYPESSAGDPRLGGKQLLRENGFLSLPVGTER